MNFYSFYFILFILVVNTKRNCELEFYVFLGNVTPFLMKEKKNLLKNLQINLSFKTLYQ